MGQVETDWGWAGCATWAYWSMKKQSPGPLVWVSLVSLTQTRGAGLGAVQNPAQPVSWATALTLGQP
jgi:hypothetical protein